VQPGEEQVKEWVDFEERAGWLLDGIERFEDGIRTIQKLLPSVKEILETHLAPGHLNTEE
jgi:hypothetical protein